MAVKFTNNAKTTLASSLTNVATSASVVDGSVFPTLGAGEYFYCTFDDGSNNEIVKVTARSGNTLTIVRGVDNTSARAFSSGDSAELRATAGLLTDIQENIAAKSANQTVFSTTTASSATDYDIGIDPGVEANASVFLDGVYQHHDTFSFSGSTLTFDTAPVDGTALEVIVDNLVNLQSSNLTVDTFIAADVGGSPQVDFTLSDAPAAETNLIVFVDGVFQANDTYTISSTTLSMTDGVTADRVVTVYVMNPVNIGTPSDGTVTSSKLSGNITMPGDLTVTGDVAFDSPTFVVDNANSRVGIGTASPSTLLDIVGDVNMSANLTVDTSTLVVDSANNRVGIGTSSPSNALDVAGNVSLATYSGTGENQTILAQNDYGQMRAGIRSGIPYIGSISALDFALYTGNTERMRIDSAGKVGIGLTNPSDYYNASLAVSLPSEASLTLASTNTTNWNYILFADGTSGDAAYRGQVAYNHQNDILALASTGYMTFASGSGRTERVRIDSNGHLIVGSHNSTTEGGKLTVYTDATNDPAIYGYRSTSEFKIVPFLSNGAFSSLSSVNDSGLFFSDNFIIAKHASGNYGMKVEGGGNVHIGTKTEATGSTGGVTFSADNNNRRNLICATTTTGTVELVEFRNPNGTVGDIRTSGTSTSYVTSSDYRLKENVTYEFNALDRVTQLKPARFNFISDADTVLDGFLAHEVSDIVPEAVSGEKDATKEKEVEVTPAQYEDDGETLISEAVMETRTVPVYQGIDHSKLVPLLTKAIQEQQEQIETLKQEIREIREGG